MKFKPMLAPNDIINIDEITYPVLVSKKLDGIRCIFYDGKMLSRSLKPIRNKKLQERFKHLAELSKTDGVIFDGELYSEKLNFQEITSCVMSYDKEIPNGLTFYCFDCIKDFDEPFEDRVDRIQEYRTKSLCGFKIVEQDKVSNSTRLNRLYSHYTEILDGEGIIIRDPRGKYKLGRATLKEGLIYKMKRYYTFDAEIIGVEERMENVSESYTNELGQSQKHRCKEDMKPTGIASAFIVKMEDGTEQKVSLTGTERERTRIWKDRDEMIGKIIEFKAMKVGSKDKLRHPVFLRFRLDKDDDLEEFVW